MRRPTLCLDFDGVLHSYSSGWKGARVIPDPPVPGALEFVIDAMSHFKVAVFSSRSHQWGGRRAMKRWLYNHALDLFIRMEFEKDRESPAYAWVTTTAFADPWEDECQYAARRLVGDIDWPRVKPPAFLSIDDRAMTFTGSWPAPEQLLGFRPWNKR